MKATPAATQSGPDSRLRADFTDAFVLATMGFSETGRSVLFASLGLIPLLGLGWYATRRRRAEAALAAGTA
jgi:MYXO-CTERM domain-containing protein